MPRLIIVAGASGAGKTFIITQLNRYRNDIIPIKKYSTRGPRINEPDDETIDLHLNCSDEELKKCTYTYSYCRNNYGIKKNEIDAILKKDKNPIVIVASCNLISKIKKDYPNALVLYVQSGLSGNDLKEQLLKYRDPMDVEERMSRQNNGFTDYLRFFNKGLFNYILINLFDDTFLQQVEYILEEELSALNSANYIFVIMSFNSKYDEIYEAIKMGGRISSQNNLIIERVSEHKGDYIITERIEKSINRAELIICDVSEKSPNVYYELGYARAKNKKILLTALHNTELPFDVRQYKTNFYKEPFHLQKIIAEELSDYYN